MVMSLGVKAAGGMTNDECRMTHEGILSSINQ
jgi:hypothetical protein